MQKPRLRAGWIPDGSGQQEGLVGAANWNNDNRNVNLNENNLDNQNDNARFRPAVIDAYETLLGGLHPSPKHPADLRQFALGLKDFGFIHQLEI